MILARGTPSVPGAQGLAKLAQKTVTASSQAHTRWFAAAMASASLFLVAEKKQAALTVLTVTPPVKESMTAVLLEAIQKPYALVQQQADFACKMQGAQMLLQAPHAIVVPVIVHWLFLPMAHLLMPQLEHAKPQVS